MEVSGSCIPREFTRNCCRLFAPPVAAVKPQYTLGLFPKIVDIILLL